jgi:hypothetical protein
MIEKSSSQDAGGKCAPVAVRSTNGVMDGQANVEKFRAWTVEVEDYRPYVRQGTLNLSYAARECGFHRDVFYTNPTIRDELLPELEATLEQAGILKPRVAQPARVVVREQKSSPSSDARNKLLQEQNEALKAENSELRTQLEKFKGMAEVLHTTGRLPW